MRFLIDIPDANDVEGPWVEIADFDTREEAIKWLQETFGADEDGKICLISNISTEEDMLTN